MTALSITLALVAVVAAALALVAVLAWRRALAASVRREEAAEQGLTELRERLAVLERVTAPAVRAERPVDDREFVITRLGTLEPTGADDTGGAERATVSLKAPAFADAVVRETVVQTASLVQGLRRALAPETRNRIRFEMKREVKRSRKDRKLEVKEALREYRARHRAGAAFAGTAGDPPSPATEIRVGAADEGVA
ncbi:hypothetical protein [Nocardioides sp. Iso805N]|uniref:hypothetical protein n=1 Tax=Nocardioides sp. Iso805N TaxID=1283287 RepID=UPI000379C67C|nr:hypothetical protein [Nocardioides sp. Iso805N]